MATLLVKFSTDTKLSDCALDPIDDAYAGVAHGSIVRNATPFHHGNHGVVYKGELSQGDQPPEEVVLKFVVATPTRQDARLALEKEFGFYRGELKDIQGIVVPKCYGMFSSPDNKDYCLVLQYCGERVKVEFNYLDMDLRLDIVDQLLDLHEHGVQHNNFAERNVVVNKDGKPFIIDFEHADPHDCEREMDVDEGVPAPNKFYFGCEEIYDYCFEYGIWRPGYFGFVGITVMEDRATSVEELIKAALEHGTTIDKRILHEEASKIFRLATAIKENGGYMPRRPKLEALGLVNFHG